MATTSLGGMRSTCQSPKVTSREDGAGWPAFLRGLIACGLSGVQMVISDAHLGLERHVWRSLLTVTRPTPLHSSLQPSALA